MVRFDIYFIAVAVFVVAVFISQLAFINCLRKDNSDLVYEFRRFVDNTNNRMLQMHSQLVSITNKAIDQLDIDIEFTRSNEIDDGK